MKRLLVISTLFALSLTLTGCQWFQQQPEPTEEDNVTETTTATVDIVDNGGDEATSTATLEISEDDSMMEDDAMTGTMLEGEVMVDDENMVGGDAMVGDDEVMLEEE